MRSFAFTLGLVLSACGEMPTSNDWSTPPSPTPGPTMPMARLHVSGNTLRDSTNREVRLRGVNICSLEFDSKGSNWQLADDGSSPVLSALANPTRWNANVVRMPVNQEWFLTDDAYVARVERLIDAADRHGLYVMLDVQWEHAKPTDPYFHNILKVPTFGPGNTTEAFWLRASGRFSNRTNLLYDLINEPHDVGEAEAARAMQRLINLIHGRVPEAIVIVGGPNWAHSVDAYRRKPLEGDNIVYSAHQYLPYDTPETFDANFALAAKTLPVLIGEFGVEPKRIDGVMYQRRLVEAAEAAGTVGWLPWAVGCGFSIDDDTKVDEVRYLADTMRQLNQ